MQKQKNGVMGAALLLAGTAIGSGMISLPMVLARFGIIGTCAIMLAFSVLIYLTAIIRADINLNTNNAASSLREAGNMLGTPFIGSLGDAMLKLLAFALMTAYMTGGASIINSLIGHSMSPILSLCFVTTLVAAIFFFASDSIVRINKVLFSGLFTMLISLMAILCWQTPIKVIPQQLDSVTLNEWATLIPVIFTSFGFHTVTHIVAKLCNSDRALVRKACLIGTAIPTVVYICWTVAILLVVANTDSAFFSLMLEGKATEVGELVRVLSNAASSEKIQTVVWIVSALAILTSILGVGFSLWDSVRREWKAPKLLSVVVVAVLPAIVSVVTPNAFITVLNVAGSILSIVAIISPVIISMKMQSHGNLQCEPLLKNKAVLLSVLAAGIGIIVLGAIDLLA